MTFHENQKQGIKFPIGELDILEQSLLLYDKQLLLSLLKDKSTKRNIKWGTSDYQHFGDSFAPDRELTIELVTGNNCHMVQPRASKPQSDRVKRTREKAEVFTPSWICNKQNNLVDEAWFGRSNVFNVETENGWTPTKRKIVFPNIKGKTWQDYVECARLEITCGEAPFLVSRYDSVTGHIFPIKQRIGLLDRKLRVVGENVKTESEWFKWAEIAFQNSYGFDYQGDNILLARENLLYTFAEYYIDKFEKDPNQKQLRRIANIISWNIWQMDGLTLECPYSFNDEPEQMTFDMIINMDNLDSDCVNVNEKGIPCRIMDWKAKKSIEFKSLIKENLHGYEQNIF